MKGFLLFQIMLYNMGEFPTIPHFYDVADVGYEKCIHLLCCKILNLEGMLDIVGKGDICEVMGAHRVRAKCRLKGNSWVI